MRDWLLHLWVLSPSGWHAHPEAYGWGLAAAGVLFAVLLVAFLIKGKFWPDD